MYPKIRSGFSTIAMISFFLFVILFIELAVRTDGTQEKVDHKTNMKTGQICIESLNRV
jgi:hypothetical protein